MDLQGENTEIHTPVKKNKYTEGSFKVEMTFWFSLLMLMSYISGSYQTFNRIYEKEIISQNILVYGLDYWFCFVILIVAILRLFYVFSSKFELKKDLK